MEDKMKNKVYDYLIIGAGPGGLQLGYCLEKAGRDYLILERGDSASTFFKTMPRHRKLISINKVYTGYDDPQRNLRWDWNSLLSDQDELLFKHYSKSFFPPAKEMVRYLNDFARTLKLRIRFGTEVAGIRKADGLFELTDGEGRGYRCRDLIMATGTFKLNEPPIPGLELAANYLNMSIDPQDFVNQRILIIGKGNSAFETADNLIDTAASIHLVSPKVLELAWKSHHVGHLRAVNNNFLDTYLLKSQNGLLEANITGIRRLENGRLKVGFKFTRAHCAEGSYEYDRVILCAGFRFDAQPFAESCRPELAIWERFPAMTSAWESTNVANLYFAGTLMQTRDFKKTQSSFIHGFRHNVLALFHMLELKNERVAYPWQNLRLSAKSVGNVILERVNRSAALWHQPGFLCDLLEIDQKARQCRHYQGLPVAYVSETDFGRLPDYLTVTLEYGPDSPEFPFEFDRFVDAENAQMNPQLHPIIRRYHGSEMVAEHHILEELEGRWEDEIYTRPLLAFLEAQLAHAPATPAVK